MRAKNKSVLNMDVFDNVLLNASQFIKGHLFFVSLNTDIKPKSIPSVHYFSIDNELTYDSFYLDFGPLNLAMLYHYCVKLRRKLNNPAFANKKIVHYTGSNVQKRVNAAFLIGSYSIIYLGFEPEEAYEILNHDSTKDYMQFRDASIGEPYTLSLLDCLRAIKKALEFGFFNFDNFDFLEYEHYERVENGDFNWIVPNKFIAFCGPHNHSKLEMGYPIHSPETYFAYFRRHKISTIIRLNKKAYDSYKFIQAGFDHKDLYFADGGTPTRRIMYHFINICETAKGAIAVHCKAGLGRTGSLIACYIMKHWKFTAEEAIAWIRICRPGSIIGHQQSWLRARQAQLWEAGELYRKQNGLSSPIKFSVGIYSMSELKQKKGQDNVTGIMRKVDCMEINDPPEPEYEESKIPTQGDKLNEIKAQRSRLKPLGSMNTDRLRRIHLTNATSNQTTLRGGKIISNGSRVSGCSSNRIVTKRIETKETAPKKITARKVVTPISALSNDKAQLSNNKLPVKLGLVRLVKNGQTYQNCQASEDQVIKRTKRALPLEKDKCSPRSVKVLRRSLINFRSETCEKTDKMYLPSVKLNKSI